MQLEALATELARQRTASGLKAWLKTRVLHRVGRALSSAQDESLLLVIQEILDLDASVEDLSDRASRLEAKSEKGTELAGQLVADGERVKAHLVGLQDGFNTIDTKIRELEVLGTVAQAAAEGVESLCIDTSHLRDRLESLQEDHERISTEMSEITLKVERRLQARVQALSRFEDLWEDIHRETTVLAKAIAKITSG